MAEDRLARKINRIMTKHYGDQELIDADVNENIDMNEILTLALMPVNAKLRTYVVGCLVRDKERKRNVDKLRKQVKQDELVPVEVHGGGKCKITIYMTKEAASRERGK